VAVGRCPICRAEVSPAANPHRPFCSERCRMVDFSAWTTERYRIQGDPVTPAEPSDGDDEPA